MNYHILLFFICLLFVQVFTIRDNNPDCRNDQDMAVFAKYKKPEIDDHCKKCGQKCLLRDSCTLSCIEEIGLTPYCSSCFVYIVDCTAKNCLTTCTLDPGQKCTLCICKYCVPTFRICTGGRLPYPDKCPNTLE